VRDSRLHFQVRLRQRLGIGAHGKRGRARRMRNNVKAEANPAKHQHPTSRGCCNLSRWLVGGTARFQRSRCPLRGIRVVVKQSGTRNAREKCGRARARFISASMRYINARFNNSDPFLRISRRSRRKRLR